MTNLLKDSKQLMSMWYVFCGIGAVLVYDLVTLVLSIVFLYVVFSILNIIFQLGLILVTPIKAPEKENNPKSLK